MKKLCITILFVTGIAFASSAQLTLPSPSPTSQASIPGNVSNIAQAVLGKLGPALGLSAAQKPNVLSAVTGFLKDKSGILGLAKTDKAAYASKFAGLQGGLFKKLKTILTVAQYTKFLGLKPKTNDATNVLSQLFF
jgi:hypothetical protein